MRAITILLFTVIFIAAAQSTSAAPDTGVTEAEADGAWPPSSLADQQLNARRRAAVKQAVEHAWAGYARRYSSTPALSRLQLSGAQHSTGLSPFSAWPIP